MLFLNKRKKKSVSIRPACFRVAKRTGLLANRKIRQWLYGGRALFLHEVVVASMRASTSAASICSCKQALYHTGFYLYFIISVIQIE